MLTKVGLLLYKQYLGKKTIILCLELYPSNYSLGFGFILLRKNISTASIADILLDTV